MSADSPRRGLHRGIQVVSPQPISDRSIIDSVAGIINDIVPQAYTGSPNSDNKESITWARFEYADVNDPSFFPDYVEGSSTPPLLLVLGYTTGVQVWLIAASGEATEVLSWRQSVVRILRILPDPKIVEDHADLYEKKRPIIAICDSAGPGPQFCSVNFISLRTGEQLKSIKFKNSVCDVLANKRSIVVTFSEKIAVFDARTFEDILTVTTCYPCPGLNPNPVALGTRWFAYSEKKLIPARRSSGGSEGEGVQSYTATVLYAAKSLGKGLRGLGETVASSLTGNSVTPMIINNSGSDITQPGVVTILDLHAIKEEKELDDPAIETVVAHFTAHSDAIVAMTFDLTGAILMTADRRGHDFHVFRIQPHPGGPTLAAVHHLYVLHRGDTTAKVQDMVFSSDTRWAAVSTVRGTTHVFPVAPYGGPVGMRTHSTPHVVNRLSRFHKSAGLTDDGTRSHSPVSHTELQPSVYPYSNPRLPPYPHPTILHPLAQIRQPSTLNHTNNQSQPSRPQQRQRLHSDDNGTLPLKICACFAPSRAWIYTQRESTNKVSKRAIDSLFIMACHGNMIQYDLEPKPATGVPKEKVCDDTTIELEVEAKGQWPLLRMPNSFEILPPLSSMSPLFCYSGSPRSVQSLDSAEDRWLSQVEIVTHAGPHRRLWMGPQFVFKTYNTSSGINVAESEAVEIGIIGGSRPARSNPVNMPHAASRPLVPVVIDGSGSSYEQSPRLTETFENSVENDGVGIGNGENQLREDLAEAMLETSAAAHRAPGRRLVVERVGQPVTKVVNPLGTVITILADEEDASSREEFDDEEDCVPDAPKSLCAEEGPASLGDFQSEGSSLRNITEICAEMRAASEPAIDGVPDENIRDVQEQKTLCVEAATMNAADNAIDFEREGAFRDIPTSLSLCAEQGEIPNSPMTQARESSWSSRLNKCEESQIQHNFAAAKYIVNYDEQNVVLAENKLSYDKLESKSVKNKNDSFNIEESEHTPKKSSKNTATNLPVNKRTSTVNKERPKYLIREHEDSILIEDTSVPIKTKITEPVEKNISPDSKITTDVKKKQNDDEFKIERNQKDSVKNVVVVADEPEVMVVESKSIETIDSFVELRAPDIFNERINTVEACREILEPMEATVATAIACDIASLPSDLPPPLDDFHCIDYHIVEANVFRMKDAMYLNQYEDDIEHIHNSEDILKIDDDKMDCDRSKTTIDEIESSPLRQRKSSKSTISDDDLEHINTSELTELYEKAKTLIVEQSDDVNLPDIYPLSTGKIGTSSDDELEHVAHSEFTELNKSPSPVIPLELSPPLCLKSPVNKSRKKSATNDEISKASIKSRTSRKRKDVVVIDSEITEADVTVIVKPHDHAENWDKSKSPEKDLAEEIDRCVEPADRSIEPTASQSLPKKTRVRTSKSSNSTVQKTSASKLIEIIDIDAMQKAEMEVASGITIPECKILEPCPEIPIARMKKSRRNKEIEVDNESCKVIKSDSLNESRPTEGIDWCPTDQKKESDISTTKSSTVECSIDEPKTSKDQTVSENKPIKKRGKKSISGSERVSSTNCQFSLNSGTCEPYKCNSTEDPSILISTSSSMEVTPCIKDTEKCIEETVDVAIPEDVQITVELKTNDENLPSNSSGDLLEQQQHQQKQNDSNDEIAPERSSSSDDLNANVVPMDTEEDSGVKEVVDKPNSTTASPSWSTVGKKNNRSKKKKRR
ncbi:uncharacterized protein LOC123261814 isoform X1 [Cotesia glomerata]|uniref:uncharacterized protein LOC123261814 isoform X1 n=1 Tax=Cotesia glomerata TaxID=32391 RepID=UPI001D016FF1|nr:uncharacterized protein LOC123261814 isoform X1 [Cotesia glomerata]XP_044579573.1 uncharacterized protein LOC123261814 isoform X1 [Cotesia glomerata]